MRYHHTKTKGDLGAMEIMADMTRKGYSILLPLTEHEAFDFVGYRDDRFVRVQAKYRTAVAGVITIPFSTSWADRNGTHTSLIDRNAIDLLAVFCPDTSSCYYVDPRTWPSKRVHLRLATPVNGQRAGIAWAMDFTQIPATARGITGGFGMPLVIDPNARHSREPRAIWLA